MKNLQRGSVKLVLILIVIIIVIAVGYFVYTEKSEGVVQSDITTTIPQETSSVSGINADQVQVSTISQSSLESDLIKKLITSWNIAQSKFSSKAGESGTFSPPDKIQFISSNTMLVHYDDGLVDHVSVVQFKDNTLTELKNVGVMSAMTLNQWQSLINTYGSTDYAFTNYQSSDYKNFSKVSSNIFVR